MINNYITCTVYVCTMFIIYTYALYTHTEKTDYG